MFSCSRSINVPGIFGKSVFVKRAYKMTVIYWEVRCNNDLKLNRISFYDGILKNCVVLDQIY